MPNPRNCLECEHGARDGQIYKRGGRNLRTMAAFCPARKVPWLLLEWKEPPEHIDRPSWCPKGCAECLSMVTAWSAPQAD